MKLSNPDVPEEQQMLYILRHWDELHERLKLSEEQSERLRKTQSALQQQVNGHLKTIAHLHRQIAELKKCGTGISTSDEKNIAAVRPSLIQKIKALWKSS